MQDLHNFYLIVVVECQVQGGNIIKGAGGVHVIGIWLQQRRVQPSALDPFNLDAACFLPLMFSTARILPSTFQALVNPSLTCGLHDHLINFATCCPPFLPFRTPFSVQGFILGHIISTNIYDSFNIDSQTIFHGVLSLPKPLTLH